MYPVKDTPYMRAVEELFDRIAATLPAMSEPVRVYLAGGAAVHALTAGRVSMDVDPILSHRVLIPQDLVVVYDDEDGRQKTVAFDYNYNPYLGLIHPDYPERAIRLDWPGQGKLELYVLAPVDLAITKLCRYAENDQSDIQGLIDAGLLRDAAGFRRLAEEALSYFVGNAIFVRQAIEEVAEHIGQVASRDDGLQPTV